MPTGKTKAQRLRNTADGFMAALVACNYRGPWHWGNQVWEFPFMKAYANWAPAARSPELFPAFRLGGVGRFSQPRELLWELRRTSPFHTYRDEELTDQPHGLTLTEFLEIWADGATPDEWADLAAAFLDQMHIRYPDLEL